VRRRMSTNQAGHALLVCFMLAAGGTHAMAAGVWDFFGNVGVGAGRTDNPRLASGHLRSICDPSSPNHDPNNPPVCAPNNPNRFTAGGSQKGEVTGTLRLTGGVNATWSNTTFMLSYSPTALFYQDRTYLNSVNHDLSSAWHHSYSPRTTMNLSEAFNYTPEQDLDPNNVQAGSLLTRQTSRISNGFRGDVGFQHSETTTLTWNYHNTMRRFSSPEFIDSTNHNAGFQWRRRVGRGSSINSGYDFGIFTFGETVSDPNAPSNSPSGSKHHQGHAGYGFSSARGLVLSLNAGYSILVPDDSGLSRSSGVFADTSIGWSGKRLVTTAGYNRGFSDGGGAFTTSRNQNIFSNLRWMVTQNLSADLAATRSVNERVSSTSAAITSSDTIRTFNGRASVNYSVVKNLGLNASFTHYRQALPAASATVPELRTNRYSVGLNWSIR